MAVQDPSLIPIEALTAKRTFTPEEKRRMVEAPGNAGAHRILFFRRFTQLATFGLFVLFFLMTTVNSQQAGWVPKNLFMSLDFLNTLKNGIASHHVAMAAIGPGLVILLLTLWGGRIFCGWICPLGTFIDISDRLLYRKGRLFANRKRSETQRFRNWKYIYLLVGVGAIVYGVDILTFGDPLSLITRTFTFCFYGPIAYIWNGLLNSADQLGISRMAYRAFGVEMSAWHLPKMIYYNAMPVFLMFIGVIALSLYQERFWCRNLCPYGGLLALIPRCAWLRHYVKMDGCIHCMKCEVQSRMGCYENLEKDAKQPVHHAIDECIQCLRCATICPPDVIQIESRPPIGLLGVQAFRRSGVQEESNSGPER